jgi:hypothetical protein
VQGSSYSSFEATIRNHLLDFRHYKTRTRLEYLVRQLQCLIITQDDTLRVRYVTLRNLLKTRYNTADDLLRIRCNNAGDLLKTRYNTADDLLRIRYI